MSSSFSLDKWKAVLLKDAEIARLLNIVDEQDFLQKYMSSASLKECIECGDNNLARVQFLVKTMSKDENVNLYNALCGYFLDRSESYKAMYQHFCGLDPDICYEKYTQVNLLQEKVKYLTEELKFLHENKESEINHHRLEEINHHRLEEINHHRLEEINHHRLEEINHHRLEEINARLDLVQKDSAELKNEMQSTFQQLQLSLETLSKAIHRPPKFPNPYSDEMRQKVLQANLSYWQGICCRMVPFLCNENGEYFVDWDNNDDQWKFSNYYGKSFWSRQVSSTRSGEVCLVACSLLLPRQFNANGLNDRVVNVWLKKNGTSLVMKMTHCDSPSANVTSTIFKCHFSLLIKHNDGTSSTELRETIECKVNNNTPYPIVFQSGALPFSSFTNAVAPSLLLTLDSL